MPSDHDTPAREPSEVEVAAVEMMSRDHARMRKAGTALAEAALRVIREYDGTHRLSLAVPIGPRLSQMKATVPGQSPTAACPASSTPRASRTAGTSGS